MSWPVAYGKRVLASVDSTNAEAARIADQVSGPEWILALSQTAARGRRGRSWVHPAGNFSATLLLPVSGPVQDIALRSFVISLAVRDAFETLSGTDQGISLKWPNDVLLNGGKVAGILLERLGNGHLAIGIGINLIAAPTPDQVEDHAVAPVSFLAETGRRVTPEAMLNALASAFAKHEDSFATWGFDPVRTAWLAHAARLGEVITARTSQDVWTGTFETVDDSGQLVLKTPQGRRRIAAADVFF